MTTSQSKSNSRSSMHYPSLIKHQLGFTLIELMISIVLGLLITAAALVLFYGSTRNLRMQESASDVQEAATFSLNYIQREINMANLGSSNPITQESPWTGIVFTSTIGVPDEPISTDASVLRQTGNLRGVFDETTRQAVPPELLSVDPALLTPVGLNSNVTVNGADTNSDQLTIQYRAPFALNDCEGNLRAEGEMVVERFFTRQEGNTAPTGEPPAYTIVLACDAGWYELVDVDELAAVSAGAAPALNVLPNDIRPQMLQLTDFGDAGQVLVNRVDYLSFRIGVMQDNGIRYMTLADYVDRDANNEYIADGPVISVQMGVLARGVDPIGTETPTTFNILGQDVVVKADDRKYVRRLYESTIYLRNGVVL